MSEEFKHKTVGIGLERAEWEGIGYHEADGQTEGDVLWFNGAHWVRIPLDELCGDYASELIAAMAIQDVIDASIVIHSAAADPHGDRAYSDEELATHAEDADAHHDNSNDPSADEKAALAGTSGTPSVGNKYVTDDDSRNSDAREPTAHDHDDDYLNKENVDEFTPDGDYEPATKKYVDDHAISDIDDFLENPPTEDEEHKAPTSEWAFDHAASASTHIAAWDDLIIDADGAVDITGKTGNCFFIHPNGAETSDTLDTITGGSEGQRITIAGNYDSYPITVTSDDNISLPGENNILTTTDRTCTLIFNGTYWVLESFGDPIGYIGRTGFDFSYAAVGINWSTEVLTTDHSYTGEWANVVAGETFTGNAFQVGYQNADGEVYLAKADSSTTMPAFCMSRNADNQIGGYPISVITKGLVRDDTWNWTPGLLYVSKDTAGAMTQTKPVYPNIAQVVSVALTADIIYFNPSLKAEDYAGILTALKAETDISGASWVLDEDNMASNSATKVPTQQSVKAYVDAAGGGGGDETISWLGV